MGEYSIAKSYKGILRIANIMQFNQGQEDELLNPYYYGSPQALMNISGGVIGNTKEYGYPNPITGLQGTSNRYTSANPAINDDELKLLRVPMTDSMGNYLNWNIGLDGVTIGSNDDINGNKFNFGYFKQKDSENLIAQEINFPILESTRLIVGLVNKLPKEQKFGISNASIQVQSSKYGDDSSIIIENLYDKTERNHERLFQKTYDDQGKQVVDGDGNLVLKESAWSYYKDPAAYYNIDQEKKHDYKKIRTVYTATKPTVQDYDVFMYKQDDWDVDNWQKHTTSESSHSSHLDNKGYNEKELLDCRVDIVNLKEYIKTKINDFLNGNVKEVPSGTVIWQYCSLKKWYSRNTDPNDGTSWKNFAGNRPALMLREDDGYQKFFNTLIQGACKKVNHLINESTKNSETQDKEEEKTQDSLSYYNDSDIMDQVIPLYKRDYLLCDGSVFRIPYRPQFNNAGISNQREAFDRFINLLFAIGYKYTERKNLTDRTDFRIDEKGEVKVQSINLRVDANNNKTRDLDVKTLNEVSPTKNTEIYDKVLDTFSPLGWVGNPPNLVNISIEKDKDPWGNLDNLDVLFGMDYASMVACDILFNQYNSSKPFGMNNLTAWVDSSEENRLKAINDWINKENNDGILFHQKYIFNTLEGDSQERVSRYWANSNHDVTEVPQIMGIPYYNFNPKETSLEGVTQDNKQILPIIYIGRQVNSLKSWIKIYDHNDKKYKIIRVHQLPNVQLFKMLLSTKHRIQDNINKFCYMYFNYNFQVPYLISKDYSPVFIGSSGVSWSDPRMIQMKKIESWTSNFTTASIPHRHAIFCSPLRDFNDIDPKNFKGDSLSNKTVSGSAYNGGSPSENFDRVDGHGSYIVNEIIGNWRPTTSTDSINDSQNITGTRIQIIDIPYSTSDVDVSFDNIVTGSHRTKIKPKGGAIVPEPIYWETVSPNDAISMEDYANYQKDYWYSFRLQDDPRFDTGQPNRGITSPPTQTINYSSFPITKYDVNKSNFYLTNANFFAPENVKMLPLIKI